MNNVPKPHPPKKVFVDISDATQEQKDAIEAASKAPVAVGETTHKAVKPKFILQPHLTFRPFAEQQALVALHLQMKPNRGQSRTKKEKN